MTLKQFKPVSLEALESRDVLAPLSAGTHLRTVSSFNVVVDSSLWLNWERPATDPTRIF